MPCPLIEPDEYPDYIKKILQQIANGDDKDLKACACLLKPVTDVEGECYELMTDGKIALFPFCIEDTEIDPTTIYIDGFLSDYWLYPVGISLDDLMLFYWQNYEVSIDGIDSLKCQYGDIIARPCKKIYKSYTGAYGSKDAVKGNVKYLVCPTVFEAFKNRENYVNEAAYGNTNCSFLWGGLIAFSQMQPYPICYRYDNKYYPSMNFTSNYLSSVQHDYDLSGQAKLKIKGKSYDFPMYLPVEYANCKASIANTEIFIKAVDF